MLSMRPSARLRIGLVFGAAFAAGAIGTLTAGAARADEALDRYLEWHRRRAWTLFAEGRLEENVEDWGALARLQTDNEHAAARAAVALVELACDPPNEPKPTDSVYRTVEDLIREGTSRGGIHDPALAYAIGRLRFADGDYMNAQAMLGIARRRGFDPIRARLWHARAVVSDTTRLLEIGDIDECIRRLERVLADFPDHPDLIAVKLNLANAYRRRGEHVLSEKLLLEIIETDPWVARAHLGLAQTYTELSRYDEAWTEFRATLDRAQEKDDGKYTGRKVYTDALLWIAAMELRRGDAVECEKWARQYLDLKKDNADGLYFLGAALALKGGRENLEEAARTLRRSNRIAGDRKDILGRLIEVLQQLGKTDEVDECAKRLEELQEKLKRQTQEMAKKPVH